MFYATQEIHQMYAEAFNAYRSDIKTPDIVVQFYPYVSINHTIRIRDGKIYVRISELCRDMPAIGQQALAYILIGKLLRRKIPAGVRTAYAELIKTPEMREKAANSKRLRGRKIISSEAGTAYHLGEIFDAINHAYFGGTIPKPILSWSARKTFRILGHHDATHDTIVISQSLDSASVPKYVVEYVVFHEMLHIYHPTKHINGRRFNHTPDFRRDEKKFEYFQQAERWIESNVRKLKKAARR